MEFEKDFDPTATSVFGLPSQQDDALTDPSADPSSSLSSRDREAVERLSRDSAFLIVRRGPNAGARFLLDPSVTNAGRSPKSDIFLDDVTVSRKHCQFIFKDGVHIIRDSGSLNGTYVNRERVDEAVLHAGDEVQIGKYRMTYEPSPLNQ